MKERTKPMKKTDTIHIFSGKVFCLECGSYMRKKNSGKYDYLVCSDSQECTNNSSIRYDEMENIILNEINKVIDKYYDLVFLEKEILKMYKNKFIKRLELLEREKSGILENLTRTNNYLQCLYEDRVNNIINLDQFRELCDKYTNDKKVGNDRINDIDKEILYYKEMHDDEDKKILYKYIKIDKLSRVVVEEFIDKIYVGYLDKNLNSRDIQIKWNFE